MESSIGGKHLRNIYGSPPTSSTPLSSSDPITAVGHTSTIINGIIYSDYVGPVLDAISNLTHTNYNDFSFLDSPISADIVYIAIPDSTPSTSRLDTLKDFVQNNGGTLLITGEFSPNFDSYNSHVSAILSHIGSSISVIPSLGKVDDNLIKAAPGSGEIIEIGNYDITSGIQEVQTAAFGVLSIDNSAAEAILVTSENATNNIVMARESVGNGNAVVFADVNIFTSANASFLSNIIIQSKQNIATATSSDTTAPTLSSSTPADDATAVAIGSNIVLEFSETVTAGTGDFILKKADGTTVATIPVSDGQVSISGSTVTINPSSDLDYSTSYYLEIASGVLKDSANNDYAGISGNTTLNFTTDSAPDTTAPTLSSSTPADDATAVAIGSNIVLEFSETVTAGTGDFVIKKADGTTVATIPVSDGQVSISGSTVTINPSTDLDYSTGYYVEIASGVLKDSANNDYAGISGSTTLNFTTAAAPNSAPVITGASGTLAFSEGDGATIIDSSLTITDVDDTNIESATVTISAGFQSAEDVLAFSNTSAITGSWNNATGVLALSGSDTIANYKAALESVTYNNTSDNPNTANRTISWIVNDGDTDSAAVTSTITITALNDAPAGTDKTITINEDGSHTFAASDFGFSDSDSNSLSAVIISSLPAAGSLTLNGTPVSANESVNAADITNLVFSPAADANRNAYSSFSFQVQDDGGTANGGVDTDQSPNTITFNVTAVDDVPVVTTAGQVAAVAEDSANSTAIALWSTAPVYATGGGSDETSQTLSYTITAIPAFITLLNGTTTVAANDTLSAADFAALTYKTVADANGSAALTFDVIDSGSGTSPNGNTLSAQSVTITVTAVDDVPVVTTAGQVAAVAEDSANSTAITLWSTAPVYATGGGSDETSQTLSYKITAIPSFINLFKADGTTPVAANTTLTAAEFAALTYQTVADANGSASLTFDVIDSGSGTSPNSNTLSAQSVTITVTTIVDIAADTLSTAEDTDLVFQATALLTNDSFEAGCPTQV